MSKNHDRHHPSRRDRPPGAALYRPGLDLRRGEMLLGVDVGTTHTKVGIYAEDGTILAHTQAPTPLERGHFPPEALWQVAAQLIRQALASSGVKALSVASMGEAGVTVDEKGEPTYPIIPWYDQRGTAYMNRLSEKLGRERLYKITGLYPNAIHTIAKWMWLHENEREIWKRTRLWLSVADYISYRLTGEAIAEISLAARTMAYDVTRGLWSGELLEFAGFNDSFLPPLVEAGTEIGHVQREASQVTGLVEGTPVYAGGHDHICAAFACGAFNPSVILDSLGTAEGLTLGLPGSPEPRRAEGFGVGPHVVKGHSYLLGGIYSSGGALEWVRRLLGLASFSVLRDLATSVKPGEAPLFIAQFRGAAPPFNDPGATGAFLNVTPEHDPAHFARAVYEGIVFELRAGVEALEKIGGVSAEVVRMVGGGGDPFWSRMRASILKRPLELARYPDMVTLGAALLAGSGLGAYSSPEEAVALTYHAERTYEPDENWQAVYEEIYPRYVSASRSLQRFRADS